MIDLHIHSNFSDGSENPAAIVEMAAKAGLGTIALTDHDSFDGLAPAMKKSNELGINLIPGCEVSCVYNNASAHVLCYFVSDEKSLLGIELEALKRDRTTRNQRLIAKLNELGIDISLDDVIREAGGNLIGRPHFAQVLQDRKIVTSIEEAFEDWLGSRGKAYIPKARITIEELARITTSSQGITSWAHPLLNGLGLDELDEQLDYIKDIGVNGLECYYGRYSNETRLELVRLARKHGLVPTGGSDFHGKYKPDLFIGIGQGDLAVPDSVAEELLSLAK